MSQRVQITLTLLSVRLPRTIRGVLQILCLLGLAGGALVFAPNVAQASTFSQHSSATVDASGEANTFLLHFQASISAEERAVVLADLDAELISWLPQINVAEVRLRNSSNDDQLMAAATGSALLAQRLQTQARAAAAIVTIEENVLVEGVGLPNDPGLLSADRSYAVSVTHTIEGWAYTQGSADVIIAVVDTGVNLDHPEFTGRLVQGYDFINNDDQPIDDNGHGTHTAGIVAAGINNGLGMVGVCPGCRLMPVKVLNQNNAGTWVSVAKGVLFAVDNGARVINLSLGAAVSSKTLEDAIAYANDNNVLVVAAAGNMGVDRAFYPAALDGVLAVSATDAQDKRWALSNYGDYIDVAAPGYAIFSTYHDLTNYYQGYNYMSGTSMASPFVAGLAGLLFSQEAGRTPTDVTNLITSTADKMGTHVDDLYLGHGRVNVARALAMGADTQWTEIVQGELDNGLTNGLSTEAALDAFSNQLFLPFVTR